jgi:putative nucleotidyltransferase with HDIG domain
VSSTGEDAYLAADRARREICEAPFDGVGRISLSAGVCDLREAGDAGELFRLADLALYWAKAKGRDQAIRFRRESHEVVSAEEQERRLERARTLAAVRALATAVDARDPATESHSERVAQHAHTLAMASGWSLERAQRLREAALVHDVGKIAIPDTILFKSGRLSRFERSRIQEHTLVGAEMLAGALDEEQVAWVRHHHERFDGRGYPDGLHGDAVPDGSHLLAIADAWDAMTVARPHGPPRSPAEALHECRAGSGRQFCPDAVAALEQTLLARPKAAAAMRDPSRHETPITAARGRAGGARRQ